MDWIILNKKNIYQKAHYKHFIVLIWFKDFEIFYLRMLT